MQKNMTIAMTMAMLAMVADASASPMTYRGNNPRISPNANPYNAGNLDKTAELTRPKDKKAASRASGYAGLSEADLLKRSVVSSLASRYQQILTGTDQSSGTINFGDGTYADFTTVGSTRFITFRDTIKGTTTDISFPL